jgi:hypothetical protein
MSLIATDSARAGGLSIRPIRAIRWASHSLIKPAQGSSDDDRTEHLTTLPQCCNNAPVAIADPRRLCRLAELASDDSFNPAKEGTR